MGKRDALDLHKKLRGKIFVGSKVRMNERNLALSYTPGVGIVSAEIAKRAGRVYDYTGKGNSVAVVSDGSSVLGLGNVGAEAALPVMEGKCVLFKEFSGIDAYPICLRTQRSREIISIVRNLAPSFGGVNLEDIEAPKCFEVEEKLQDLGIPVMHDDQHGTAIVVYAALMNACKVLKKNFSGLRVVVGGAGAAGSAITKLMMCDGYGGNVCSSVGDVIVLDSKGALSKRRKLSGYKKHLVRISNRDGFSGKLEDALKGADVFIGVSRAGVLKSGMIRGMSKDAIVFALANPVPEIMPKEALKAGAAIVATGRSDFPNQVNNALAFPGVFRGALNCRARRISVEMKLGAAMVLARSVGHPSRNKILPSIFDKKIVRNISQAVEKC